MKNVTTDFQSTRAQLFATALVCVSLAVSITAAQDVLTITEVQTVPVPVATPAPAVPAAVPVRPLSGGLILPNPAIVAPAPVSRPFNVIAPTPVGPARAIAPVAAAAQLRIGLGIRANQSILLATGYPNPWLFGVNLIALNPRDIALARIKLNAQQQAAQRRIAVAAPRVRLNNMAANKGVEMQMRKALEPILKTEISFASRAADLNPDEKKKLVASGKQWFDKFIVDFVKNQDPNQQQMMLQGAQAVFFGNQQKVESPRDRIRAGMAKVVASTLSKEKAAAYTAECRKRDEFIRQVSVDNLVERLDEKVKLSPDQWKKITKSLNEHWDKQRDPQLEAFVINGNMWPGAPDQWVLPELTPAQQNIVKRINTMSGRIFFGGGMLGAFMGGGDGGVIDDVDFETVQPADSVNP